MLRASGPCAVGHVGKARRRTRRPRHHRGLAGSVGQPRRRDLLEISGTLSRWSSVLLRASSTTSAGGIAASTDVAARPQARPAVAVRAASLLCLRIEGAVAPAVQAKRAINKGRGALKPVRFAGKSQALAALLLSGVVFGGRKLCRAAAVRLASTAGSPYDACAYKGARACGCAVKNPFCQHLV